MQETPAQESWGIACKGVVDWSYTMNEQLDEIAGNTCKQRGTQQSCKVTSTSCVQQVDRNCDAQDTVAVTKKLGLMDEAPEFAWQRIGFEECGERNVEWQEQHSSDPQCDDDLPAELDGRWHRRLPPPGPRRWSAPT